MKKLTLATIKPVKLNIPDLSHLNSLGKFERKKKLRKPRALKDQTGMIMAEIEHDGRIIFVESVRDNWPDHQYCKRLHKWLGKAIEYLEHK